MRKISFTPSSTTPDTLDYNPHTKIQLPSPARELPVKVQGSLEAQGYITATKVVGGILAILVAVGIIAAVGWIGKKVKKWDQEINLEAEKCCKLAIKLLDKSKKAEAKKMFDQALSWNPSSPSIQARAYCGLGSVCDGQKAIGYFTQAIGVLQPISARFMLEIDRSNLSLAYLRRAASYVGLDSYNLALRDLQFATGCDFSEHKSTILFGFSQVYACMGRNQEALDKCIEAIKESKNPENTLEYLDFVLRFLPQKDDQHAEMLSQKADCYFDLEKFEEALKALNEALGCYLKSEDLKAEILMSRGVVQARRKKSDLALEDVKKAFSCGSPSVKDDLLYKSSLVYFYMGDLQKAFEVCLEAVRESQNPKNTLEYYKVAVAFLKQDEVRDVQSIDRGLQNFERLKILLESEPARIAFQLADLELTSHIAESETPYIQEIEILKQNLAKDMEGLRKIRESSEKTPKEVSPNPITESPSSVGRVEESVDDFD